MDASLRRIERLNYLLGGILVIVVTLFTRRDQALGAAVGAALTCINFAALRRLVVKWTNAVKAPSGPDAERGSRAIYLILPKMIGLMAAVVLAMWLLPIDAIFFVIGYSIFIVSIVLETARSGLRGTPTGDDSTPTS